MEVGVRESSMDLMKRSKKGFLLAKQIPVHLYVNKTKWAYGEIIEQLR